MHIVVSHTKMIPKYFFLTKGVGKHKERLQSFELALGNAGIQHCNIVNVSSIIPPSCKQTSREKGFKMLEPGEIAQKVALIVQINQSASRVVLGATERYM